MKRVWLSALVLAAAWPATAADTIVFGAAISITGKTAKEGDQAGAHGATDRKAYQ